MLSASSVAAVVALPVAFIVLAILLRTPALGGRLVAVPSGERWHDRATPTFGGVGIVAGLLAGVGLATALGAVPATRELGAIVGATLLLFLAGLLDDVRHLSPIAKLAAQFFAAGLVIAAGLRVDLVGNDVVATAIAFVWLVGITNAFNLLDNMDGLAATLATVACAYFAIDAATVHKNALVLVLSLALGAACLGFLPLNLRPGRRARVFMGDSASQVLGFLVAVMGLATSWTAAGTTIATMVLPLLVLAIPILDTTLVTVKRMAEKRPVTQGGRDHTSHRLVYYGLSEAKAVGLLAIIALVLGATGVAYNVLDRPAVTAVGVLLSFVLLVQFGAFLGELSESQRTGAPGDMRLRHALTVEPRRLAEMLVDFALICAVFFASYVAVVGDLGGEAQRGTFLACLPIVLGVRYVAFVAFRVYRRAWRYAIGSDFVALVLACLTSGVVAYAIVEATRRLGDFPARVFLVDAVLITVLMIAARLLQRRLPHARAGAESRAIVVGADARGRGVVRDLRARGVRVVGFVDENERLARTRVLGIPVLPLAELDQAIGALGADRVVASSGASAAARATLDRACAAAGIRWEPVAD